MRPPVLRCSSDRISRLPGLLRRKLEPLLPKLRLTYRECGLLSHWLHAKMVHSAESTMITHIKMGYSAKKMIIIIDSWQLCGRHELTFPQAQHCPSVSMGPPRGMSASSCHLIAYPDSPLQVPPSIPNQVMKQLVVVILNPRIITIVNVDEGANAMMTSRSEYPVSEIQNLPFRLSFNYSPKVDSQGSRATSNAGLLMVRELNEWLGLSQLISDNVTDAHHVSNTGRCLSLSKVP
jgi:hypothetical protein